MPDHALLETPLHSVHLAAGARMAPPFALCGETLALLDLGSMMTCQTRKDALLLLCARIGYNP